MKTENLSTLKIHRLTQEQYNREKAAGRIEENALYLTSDTSSDSDSDSDCGIYVGPGEMPEDCNVQIDPDGDSFTLEELRGEKGESGVYVGSGDMPEDYNVQIDPDGDTFTFDELKGNDGKSAYQYAKDGGYTGTEEEFAQKLATEVTAEQIGALPLTGGVITIGYGSRPLEIVGINGTIPLKLSSIQSSPDRTFINFNDTRYLGVWHNGQLACVESTEEVSGPSSKGVILMTGDNGTLKVPTPFVPGNNYQDPSLSLLRNSKLVSVDTDPAVNGEIVWLYG